jgi:hypothetical protein
MTAAAAFPEVAFIVSPQHALRVFCDAGNAGACRMPTFPVTSDFTA